MKNEHRSNQIFEEDEFFEEHKPTILEHIVVISLLIFIGGIITIVGGFFLDPSYSYPSIKVFIITFLYGGVWTCPIIGFVLSLGYILLSVFKKDPVYLISNLIQILIVVAFFAYIM